MNVLRKFNLFLVFLSSVKLFTSAGFFDVSENQIIPRYISFLINENNKKDQTQNHNVAIIRIEYNPVTDIFGRVAAEILKENVFNSVVIYDYMITKQRIYKKIISRASFIIIVSDLWNRSFLIQTLSNIFINNPWKDSTKFIFVYSHDNRLTPEAMYEIFFVFEWLGVLNLIITSEQLIYGKKIRVYGSNEFQNRVVFMIRNPSNIDSVFRDKLKNLRDYEFKIFLTDDDVRIAVNDKTRPIEGIDVSIMKIIAEKHNGRIMFETLLYSSDANFPNKFVDLLTGRKSDMTLSTNYYMQKVLKYINTFDENGYCALVPIPPRLTFIDYILTHFDNYSWGFMCLSIIVCSVFWRFLTRQTFPSNSLFYFIFGVVANFVGQSIPFRKSRRIQVILLQLCILMTFILGNAYQSLIIGSMLTSRDGVRMKTFDELFNSNMSFKVDGMFYNKMSFSEDYPSAVSRMQVVNSAPKDIEKSARENIVLIGGCELINQLMFFHANASVILHYYYLLPEKIMKFYERFPINNQSPFFDFIQSNYLYIFESGIQQPLKYFFSLIAGNKAYLFIQDSDDNNETDVKKFALKNYYRCLLN
ncbi:CLUMA_CG016004, isoform A [Clunio marinus]|uniref:CLUMA_CG016004, isoform A n=1 Tax=Clunio marinus TaxID=568069 RepID=A0A1J1IRQ0_9DIPT|nr:CLUMA_CG016004, isoform A [Clunio marinus]